MTSLGRPEAAETAATVLAYSGGVIDRAASQRSDPGFLDATFAMASTRLIPMWRDQCVVSGEPAVPVIRPAAEAGAVMNAAAEVVFLGLDDRGGNFRTCQNEACARLHFPRVEPAVIMLVEKQGRCLLARHKGSAAGSYSTLAGFVGVCESLEDAVRREVAEETGVPVGTVTYMASQGWPFPSGVMIGFRATALAETVHVDGEEVVEARWFTRAELAEHAAAAGRLGREDSIDRYLLRSWLEEPT